MTEIAELPDGALRCRTFGHAWQATTVEPDSAGRDQVRLECSSCGTARVDTVSRLGFLHGRLYVYPENYLGLGITSRDEYRSEYLNRWRAS